MFLEEDKNLLFTASLDNKIFRYNIDYASEFIRKRLATYHIQALPFPRWLRSFSD